MSEIIRTIRLTTKHVYDPNRLTFEYYAGKHKRHSNLMTFTNKPHLARSISFNSPEEELKLLEEARRSTGSDYSRVHADWVELTTTTSVQVLTPSDEFMELLRIKLITNFTPTELKALGLTGQAVHLKLMKE